MVKRTRKKTSTAEDLKCRAKDTRKKKKADITALAPTGSTMLNLACSDHIDGGWPLGKINTLPGGSASGKSLILLTGLACMANDDRFKDYELVFDDVEQRISFDIDYLFGKKLAARLKQPPNGTSDTVEQMAANVTNLHKAGKPFFYCLDSLDALTTSEELEKEQQKAIIAAKGDPDKIKTVAEAFAGRKANLLGQFLRQIKSKLADTNSCVLITQQLRVNIGAGPFGKKFRTSGGEAPFFYSHVRPALTKIKSHKAKDYRIGVRTKFELEKNSVTGKARTGEFDIYYDMGIDDIGSIVDWLCSSGHWKKAGGFIKARELGQKMQRSALIKYIEDSCLEDELRGIVQNAWTEHENSLLLQRKPRFD